MVIQSPTHSGAWNRVSVEVLIRVGPGSGTFVHNSEVSRLPPGCQCNAVNRQISAEGGATRPPQCWFANSADQ
jgi:hypothetical protein